VVSPNKASPWTDCAFVRFSGNLRFSEKRQETSITQLDNNFPVLIFGTVAQTDIAAAL